MLDKIFYFIMVPMVYMALAVFIIGILYVLIRVARAPKQTTPLRIFPIEKRNRLKTFIDTVFMPPIRREKKIFWFWKEMVSQ